MMNPFSWLQMTNMISYQGLVRTFLRTGLSRLQCPSEVAEAILGHTKKGLIGTYDLHRYTEQSREWLQRWADHLDTLVTTS